jgi:beta-phosphoglucomutase-like phosphatase (HAD superfamily)
MGMRPEEYWAAGDSPNGVAFASAARLRIIGISGIHAPEALAQGGDGRIKHAGNQPA